MNALVQGLYPILSDNVVDPQTFVELAGRLAALTTVMQVRVKALADRDAVTLHAAIADRLSDWPGLLVINDRADLARLLWLHCKQHRLKVGLHLGQTDLPPEVARAIVGPEVAIGLSTHDLAQLRAALAEAAIDHVALGPIFGTQSKANPDPVVGLDVLREGAALAEAAGRPLVAIGGITATSAPAVYAAGAAAVAVIGALFADLDGAAAFLRPRPQ